MIMNALEGSDKVASTKLGRANEARRRAEASALASVMRERSRGNAQGAHGDKRMKRLQTRSAKVAFAIRDSI